MGSIERIRLAIDVLDSVVTARTSTSGVRRGLGL